MAAVKKPTVTKPPNAPGQPLPLSGRPTTGKISRIVTGKSHAFIRDASGREVFFHRADVVEGRFNDLEVGDRLAFEAIEDRVSGWRGIRVRKVKRASKAGKKR